MAERQITEIDAGLLDAVREVAEEQGLPEIEILEAAVAYLSFLDARAVFAGRPAGNTAADIGRPIRMIHAGRFADPDWQPNSLASVFAFVQRWQQGRGVDPPSDISGRVATKTAAAFENRFSAPAATH